MVKYHLILIDLIAIYQSSISQNYGNRLFFKFQEKSNVKRLFESKVKSLKLGGVKNN